ncbi:hypothetical protein H0H93_015582 [Arthromyces matolae]|nr:hypothetical protein H0H93_015582 [Arthromyces matolae]
MKEYHPSTLANPEVASLFRLTLDEDQQPVPRLSPPATQSLPVIFGRYTSPVYVGEEIVHSLRLLVAEIIMGLGFLHSRGFVHQDIKPENLLFSCSGHVVIGDFGATSKMPIISDPQQFYLDDNERTCYGPIVLDADDFVTFTPLYAAPELKIRTPHGQVVYDHRSDWWSLGVVLYELATGTVPFQSLTGPRLAHHGRRSDEDASLAFGQLEALSAQFKKQDCDWYLDLENFIRLMLSHRPEDRLAWPDVKDHAFLAPLRGHWDDIASLKYPPCPNPPSSQRMDETSSLKEGNNTKLYEATSIPAPSFEGLSGKVHVDDLSQSSSSRERPPGIPDVSSDAGSDEASIPQTMPSSASIWASQPTTHTLKSNLHASDSGFRAFEVAAIVDKYLVATPHLPSPFYPTPDLDAHHHHNHQNSQSGCSTSYSSEPDHLECWPHSLLKVGVQAVHRDMSPSQRRVYPSFAYNTIQGSSL